MQSTITKLNTQLTEANKLLMDNVNVMDTLRTKVAVYETNGRDRGGGNSGRGGGGRGAGSDANVTFTHYCWTHGPKCGHTSQQCSRRAEGHKEEATTLNKLGGRPEKWKRYGA